MSNGDVIGTNTPASFKCLIVVLVCELLQGWGIVIGLLSLWGNGGEFQGLLHGPVFPNGFYDGTGNQCRDLASY